MTDISNFTRDQLAELYRKAGEDARRAPGSERERLQASDKQSVETRRAIFNQGPAPSPTARGIATPEPGAGSVIDTFEKMWARELLEATPSPVMPQNTMEHYEAVQRSVDRRRQELHQQAQAIANRKPQS